MEIIFYLIRLGLWLLLAVVVIEEFIDDNYLFNTLPGLILYSLYSLSSAATDLLDYLVVRQWLDRNIFKYFEPVSLPVFAWELCRLWGMFLVL